MFDFGGKPAMLKIGAAPVAKIALKSSTCFIRKRQKNDASFVPVGWQLSWNGKWLPLMMWLIVVVSLISISLHILILSKGYRGRMGKIIARFTLFTLHNLFLYSYLHNTQHKLHLTQIIARFTKIIARFTFNVHKNCIKNRYCRILMKILCL